MEIIVKSVDIGHIRITSLELTRQFEIKLKSDSDFI